MNIFVLLKDLNFVFLYSVITKVVDTIYIAIPSPMTKNLEFFSHVNVCALSSMALRSVIGSSTFVRITRNAAFCKRENKGTHQVRGNQEADQHICFC